MRAAYWSTTLLLIRHGQARSPDTSYDQHTPLSDVGRAQADHLATALSTEHPPSAVYTSPYPRAVQTAAPLCQKLQLDPIVDLRLAEFDLGSHPFEVVQQRPDLVVWHPNHRGVEHGETLAEFAQRVAALCIEVVARHPQTSVALVAHSGTIDAALRWAMGLTPDTMWQHEFDLPTASITEIEYWPHGQVAGGAPHYAVIRRIGSVSHLGSLVSDI